MCFFPRLSSLWPLCEQCFCLLSFTAKDEKDSAKGWDTFSSPLPETIRAVEMKKHRLQVDDAPGRAKSINMPATAPVTGRNPTGVFTERARTTKPQSFRNEEVPRALMVPTLITPYQACTHPSLLWMSKDWLLTAPSCLLIQQITFLHEEAPISTPGGSPGATTGWHRVTKSSLLPQSGTSSVQFTCQNPTHPSPVGTGWSSAEAETTTLLSSSPAPSSFPHPIYCRGTPSINHRQRNPLSGSIFGELH